MARFAALDGLRGVSALMVALHHLPLAFHSFGSPLIREAYTFVDFFFVLSGFVIAHAYGSRLASGRDLVDFLVRRIGRLWPLHLAALAVLVASECCLLLTHSSLEGRPAFAGQNSLAYLVPNALLIHSWGVGVLSWNGPSWSLSAELLAYIVFGATVILSRGRAIAMAAAIVALTWFISLTIVADFQLYAAFPSLRAICGFFAGVLVHAAFIGGGRPNWSPRLATALEITAVALIVGYLAIVSRPSLTPWAMPVFLPAVYVFAAERGAVSHLLKSRPLQLLGTLSYSIYLLHTLVITALRLTAGAVGKAVGIDPLTPGRNLFPTSPDWYLVDLGNAWLNDLYGLVFLATLIGLSTLTYRYIELPGQRLFGGFAARRFTRTAMAS
jgi:peptidoglycan/LPS O-acetylase OafA/YrhL